MTTLFTLSLFIIACIIVLIEWVEWRYPREWIEGRHYECPHCEKRVDVEHDDYAVCSDEYESQVLHGACLEELEGRGWDV